MPVEWSGGCHLPKKWVCLNFQGIKILKKILRLTVEPRSRSSGKALPVLSKQWARSSPLQDFWLDHMSLTLPSIMCFVDLEKVYWGELWEYGVCLLLQATGSMYNQSQSCPHFWHKIRHVFSGCWAPPGLNFISNPICHIH